MSKCPLLTSCIQCMSPGPINLSRHRAQTQAFQTSSFHWRTITTLYQMFCDHRMVLLGRKDIWGLRKLLVTTAEELPGSEICILHKSFKMPGFFHRDVEITLEIRCLSTCFLTFKVFLLKVATGLRLLSGRKRVGLMQPWTPKQESSQELTSGEHPV